MSKFDECIQPGDKIVHNDGYRVNVSQLKRVAKKSEIKDYITRMVPDIARKCGCMEDDVWRCIDEIVRNDLPQWKILDPVKAEEAGVACVGNGIIAVDASKLNPQVSLEEYLGQLSQEKIIELQPSKLLKKV